MSHRWSVTTPRVFHEGRKFHYVCGGFESWRTFAPPRNALHTPFPRHLPRGGMQLSVDLTCVDHKSELDSVVCEVKQFSPSYFFFPTSSRANLRQTQSGGKGNVKIRFRDPEPQLSDGWNFAIFHGFQRRQNDRAKEICWAMWI